MEASISFCRAMRACHQSAWMPASEGVPDARTTFWKPPSVPMRRKFARDFPFLPILIESRVQLDAQRLQLGLPLVPDDVNLGVVGDGFERDVRHAFVDEAMANVPVHGLRQGAVRVTSASLIWPSRESASR